MWTFIGEYTGEAKEYMQGLKKKEARIYACVFSVLIVLVCLVMALILNMEDTMIDTVVAVGIGVLGIAVLHLVLFLSYKRAPRCMIEIQNDGFQWVADGFTRSLAFYKVESIEYYDEFIAVRSPHYTFVLQKDLLVKGDWKALKGLMERLEESLKTDEPMYQIDAPKTEYFSAVVKTKRIYEQFVGRVSIKAQEGVFQYFATFQLEGEREAEYSIGQALYEQLKEGQEGILVLVNGNFFAFGDGEELE